MHASAHINTNVADVSWHVTVEQGNDWIFSATWEFVDTQIMAGSTFVPSILFHSGWRPITCTPATRPNHGFGSMWCAAWKAGSSVSGVINVCAAWWPNFTRCVSVWVVQREVRYWGAWYRRTASSWSAECDLATAWGSIGRLWQTNIHSMSISSTKPPACTPQQFVSCAFLKVNVP